MSVQMKVFKSYGVLAHEKEPFYSVSAPASDIYDVIAVDIPYDMVKTVSDDHIVRIGDETYLLSELLCNIGERPALRWFDGQSYHTEILEVLGV